MMNITISRYQPLRGGSYIVLPEYISDKKHASTYTNEDDHCLRWVLRSARFPCSKHTDRTSSYRSEAVLISTESTVQQKQNKMAINVFGYENKAIVPYQLSDQPASIARLMYY